MQSTKPALDKASPAPTNVCSYDELLNYCRGKEVALPRSRDGLVVIDALIEDPEARMDLTGLLAMDYDHEIDLIDEDRLRCS